MIKINEELFSKVFGLIFENYLQKAGIFKQYSARKVGPQYIFYPSNVEVGDIDHLYFLALVAFSDKRTDSMFLYKNFSRMFSRNPKLFLRGQYPSLPRMTKLFQRYKIALPAKEIAFFIKRKHHLDELFGGDPLKIYEGVKDIDNLMRNLKNLAKKNGVKNLFPGAKEKIFCLLAMFISEFTDLQFADILPVDSWVQSICATTEVLHGRGHIKFQALGRHLRPLVSKAFAPYRDIDGAVNATWILGKFGCTNCNKINTKGLCPVYHLCKGPFKSMRHPVSNKHLGAIQIPPRYKF